ncbi:MAG: alpha-ketoglutarate-dependent dioxygenase AlkB family protein [Wenzhouxiangella sp.]
MLSESAQWDENVDLPPAGQVRYCALAAPGLRPAKLFTNLGQTLDWRQLPVRMFGRSIPQPRLTDFRADPGVGYRYSGLSLEARPWTDDLALIRQIVERRTGCCFNSVLCNFYRDGRDYMGWHADNEPELGPEPVIASVSFGAQRRFVLKPRTGGPERVEFELESGSLLLMCGDVQEHWLHQLPRAMRVSEARINLTFRKILNP